LKVKQSKRDSKGQNDELYTPTDSTAIGIALIRDANPHLQTSQSTADFDTVTRRP